MLTGAHALGRRHSLQGQGNFILENVQAHHITSKRRGGGGKVLLKMARELQKELQLSPGTAAFPRCQPRDCRGDAEHKPPQVRGRSRGPGRPRNAGYSHRQPCPAHSRRSGRRHAGEPRGQRRAACSSLPTTWALNHLFRAEDAINLDVGACPRVFFGEEGVVRAG